MSSYNPNIPQGPDIISKSQPQLKNNFSSSNDAFSVDHFPFNEPDSAKLGHHRKVIFPEGLTSDPNLAKGAGASLYTKKIGDLLELFFQNDASSSAVRQLTDLTVASQANLGTAGGTIYTISTPWNLVIYCGYTDYFTGSRTVLFPTNLTSIYCNVGSADFGQSDSKGGITCEKVPPTAGPFTGLLVWTPSSPTRRVSYFVLGKI